MPSKPQRLCYSHATSQHGRHSMSKQTCKRTRSLRPDVLLHASDESAAPKPSKRTREIEVPLPLAPISGRSTVTCQSDVILANADNVSGWGQYSTWKRTYRQAKPSPATGLRLVTALSAQLVLSLATLQKQILESNGYISF